ncbi:MAG TPA: TonB-dependent receptor [Candidatus Angelobacter sp.]|nr:TonB-dependent receptor [Candidatus Angelobacter sp.]
MTRSQIGCIVLVFSAALAWAEPRIVQGTVRDQRGYVVTQAHIAVQGTKYERTTISGSDGTFRIEGAPREPLTLAVDATGFDRFTTSLPADNDQLDVVLRPAMVSQEINVTANRVGTALGETAESVEVLSRQQMQSAAAEVVDQVLREVPGFTLFRRSDSRTANPTSQGASLRGIGGNGASRAIVLFDDIPLNDPFGGWVYWGRIPREDVSSIEVLRGGGSSLYGSDALTGVVNVTPLRASGNLISAEISGGSESTPDASLTSAWFLKSWTLGTSGEFFRSDGYVLVPSDQRGTVDTPANSYHGTGLLTARRKLSAGDLFLVGDFYDEARNNGTPLTTNDTQLAQLSGGLNLLTSLASIQLRGYGSEESYNQTFSSIAANRHSETLTRAQHVPAQQAGGSLTLSRQLERNLLVGGVDGRFVRGFSNETAFASSLATSLVDSGGRQQTFGAFVQDAIRLHSRLLFTMGLRYDNWDDYQAHTRTTPLMTSIKRSFTAFPDQSDHAFSPRGALLFRATDGITLTASAYRSFRAPTLNELYRSFRLGNVLTLANAQLQAERLLGAEAGANFFLGSTHIHTAFYWMALSDPVANVTLSTTPALITRQRENLGRTRSRGVEADASWRFHNLDVIAGYQFVDAVVTSFRANPALVGLEIPQVAPHQFTLQTRYSLAGGWTIAAQARASSRQFEDDLNQFPLDSFFQLDTYVSKRLRSAMEVFAAVENLFDSRIQVARTPTLNVGPPIFARAGVKLHWE